MIHKLFLAAVVALSGASWAADVSDYLSPTQGTQPVALTGGDTVKTYSVTCNLTGPTQIRAAVTDRSRRRICVQNRGADEVAIGSSTLAASNFWVLGASTNSATSPQYCTTSSAELRCSTINTLMTSSVTVRVIEETQSIP